MVKKLDLREAMPITAALVAEFRAVFGAGNINDVVRRGMAGEPVFYATENGHVIGTPPTPGVRIGLDAAGNRHFLDGPPPDWRPDPRTKYRGGPLK